MLKSVVVFFLILKSSEAVFFVDNAAVETNPSLGNIKVNYTHDSNGNAVVNITIQPFVTITKMLVYFKINLAEDSVGFKRELVNVVMDVEKLFKGSQANPLVKVFIGIVKKFMDFKAEFPIHPGTYRFINTTLDDSFMPLLQDMRGNIDLRFIGKIAGVSTNQFFGRMTFFGGLRR